MILVQMKSGAGKHGARALLARSYLPAPGPHARV